MPISSNPISFLSDYSSPIHLYLFISPVYPPRSLSIFCLSRFTHISFDPLSLISAYPSYIDLYLFLSFCQSESTGISFNAHLFISVYPSSIYLYWFLSLSYSSLFLYISLSIQVHDYLFPSLFILALRSSYLVDTVSLFTDNYFYLLNRKEINNYTANI